MSVFLVISTQETYIIILYKRILKLNIGNARTVVIGKVSFSTLKYKLLKIIHLLSRQKEKKLKRNKEKEKTTDNTFTVPQTLLTLFFYHNKFKPLYRSFNKVRFLTQRTLKQRFVGNRTLKI